MVSSDDKKKLLSRNSYCTTAQNSYQILDDWLVVTLGPDEDIPDAQKTAARIYGCT